MAGVLVIRFSALGDVAISVPLVNGLAEQYPEHKFIMVSKPQMEDLFSGSPSNVHFVPAFTKGRHKGIWGLYRLYKDIKPLKVDVVCDVHNVHRSKILSFFFKCSRIPVFRIDKQRNERRKLVRKRRKQLKQLKTSFERYRDVFAKAGFSLIHFDTRPKLGCSEEKMAKQRPIFGEKNKKWIGIAPFAKHEGKIYPGKYTEQVIESLLKEDQYTLFLFGGGAYEKSVINQWKTKYPKIQVPSQLQLKEEVELMACLDVMLTMDSANMHLASIAHTPVVSIWGATHPFAGFYGLFQSEFNAVQLDLDCRPCSIYGNIPCYKGNYPCLNGISPEVVVRKLKQTLNDL